MALLPVHKTADNFTAVLTNAPGLAGTSIDVDDASGIPDTPFRATVALDGNYQTNSEANEIVIVTSVAATNFTVTRGADGTTPIDLQVGDHIECRPIAWHTNELQDAITTGGTDVQVRDVTCRNVIPSQLVDGRDVASDGVKLDTIASGADETNETNVEAAGAVMNKHIDTVPSGRVINDPTMASASDQNITTSIAAKQYVDNQIAADKPVVSAGTDDTTAGRLEAFGDANIAGGICRLHFGATEDTPEDYVDIEASAQNVEIKNATGTVLFQINAQTGNITVPPGAEIFLNLPGVAGTAGSLYQSGAQVRVS